jgi:S1-C subfamily serine protease
MQSGYVRGIPCLGDVKLVEKTGGNFLNVIYGAYVYDPGENTPFEEGDYIYSIDGTVVYGISSSALDAVERIVRSHKVGDTVSVVVKRGSSQVTLSVTLTEYIPDNASINVQG